MDFCLFVLFSFPCLCKAPHWNHLLAQLMLFFSNSFFLSFFFLVNIFFLRENPQEGQPRKMWTCSCCDDVMCCWPAFSVMGCDGTRVAFTPLTLLFVHLCPGRSLPFFDSLNHPILSLKQTLRNRTTRSHRMSSQSRACPPCSSNALGPRHPHEVVCLTGIMTFSKLVISSEPDLLGLIWQLPQLVIWWSRLFLAWS